MKVIIKMNDKEKLNGWNKYLHEEFGIPKNVKLEKKKINFWKAFSVVCLCSFLIFGYLVFYTDKLDGLISPNFNNDVLIDNPVNVSNSYDIDTPVTNNYQHNIDNNNTFYIINDIKCPTP